MRMRFGRERLGSAGIQVLSCAGFKTVFAVEGGRRHYVPGKAGDCTMTPIPRSWTP